MKWGLIGTGDIVRKRVAAALRDAPGSSLAAVSRKRAELADGAARLRRRTVARAVAGPGHRSGHRRGLHRHARAVPRGAGHCRGGSRASTSSARSRWRWTLPSATASSRRARQAASSWASPTIATSIRSSIASARSWQRERSARPSSPRSMRSSVSTRSRTRNATGSCSATVSGGGPMFDFGCHRIELLLSFFGPVRQTAGLTANVVFDREVEDTAVAAMTFVAGPCATVTVTHAAIEPRDTVRIFGSEGSIHVSSLNGGDLTIVRDGRRAVSSIRRRPTCTSPWSRTSSTRCARAASRLWTGKSGVPWRRSKRESINAPTSVVSRQPGWTGVAP